MTTSAMSAAPPVEAFATPPPTLELFTRLRSAAEHHVYLKALPFSDFARLFGNDVKSLSMRVTRMPGSLLNPNYWEPLTRQNEQQVRDAFGGVITRSEGDRLLIWRADSIAAGRYLRDGIDIPAQLLPGGVFRLLGEAVIALGLAWEDVPGERFEWIGFSALPDDQAGRDPSAIAREDLSEFRFSVPQERIAFASNGRATRLIFADRAHVRRLVGTAVRRHAMAALNQWTTVINERVSDQIGRIADGVGWLCDAKKDLIDKHRTLELTAHLGQTEWGVHLPPGHPPFIGNEKALVYYDRSSGIWAVAT